MMNLGKSFNGHFYFICSIYILFLIKCNDMTLSSIFFILELESIYIPPVFLVHEGIGWGLDLIEVYVKDRRSGSPTISNDHYLEKSIFGSELS